MKSRGVNTLNKFIKTVATAAIAFSISTNVFAMSFANPYGYNLPLKDFAANPDGFKSDMNVVSNHDISYESDVLNLISKGSGMSFFYLGGQGQNGDTKVSADSHNKEINTFTYSLTKSEHYDGLSPTGDTYDCNTFVNVNGSWQNFRFKGEIAGPDSYSAHINWSGGGSPLIIRDLSYDEFYSVIVEADIEGKYASMRLEDAQGNILGVKYAEGINITAVRSGFRFRTEEDYNFKIKEMSSLRETYILKNFDLTKDGNTVTATIDVAADCTQRSINGEMPAAPSLFIGQFDSEDRLLGYEIKTAELSSKAASADSAAFETFTASVVKHRDFDHAKAMLVTNGEDFLPLCGALTVDNQ